MGSPLVSVIVNCFNHQEYVGESLTSVIAQTYRNIEIILIDNGSTDNTRDVLDSFSDPRISRYYFNENRSLSERLNFGVARSNGSFISILYSDDMLILSKIEDQMLIFNSLDCDYGVVYSPAISFNEFTAKSWLHDVINVDGYFTRLLLGSPSSGFPDMCSPLFRAECLKRCKWYNEIFGDGEAILLRIGLLYKFFYSEHPVVRLRDHDRNLGKSVHTNHDNFLRICDLLAQELFFPPGMLTLLNRYRAIRCRSNCWVALRLNSDNIAWIQLQLLNVWKYYPHSVLHLRYFACLVFAVIPFPLRKIINKIVVTLLMTRENALLSPPY